MAHLKKINKEEKTSRKRNIERQREGGTPGLEVMGGDSCSKGREFESWDCILDGHFSHLFVVKIVMCV